MDEKLAPIRENPAKFAEIAASVSKRTRGLHAPAAAIEAVRWALDVPFEEAERRVRSAFQELRQGEQSKAQRYIFFAEREAAKVPGLPPGIRPRDIARAAVIGAGTMGGGIAMCFANAGIPVSIIETAQEPLKRGLDTIAKNYSNTVKRGGLAADEMARPLVLIAC